LANRNTFKVYERLKREQHINTLFLTGKAFSVFPLRVIYLIVPRPAATASPVMTGFSIPKKKFRHSVDRHRIRRLIFEAWRLSKHLLYMHVPQDKQLHLFFIYTDKEMPEYATIQTAMAGCITRLITIATVAAPKVKE
jgi:ribonuclease P protein component